MAAESPAGPAPTMITLCIQLPLFARFLLFGKFRISSRHIFFLSFRRVQRVRHHLSAFNNHAFADFSHAGASAGFSIYRYAAFKAVADVTVDAFGSPALFMYPQLPDTLCKQGRCNGISFMSFVKISVQSERNLFLLIQVTQHAK